MIKKYIKLLLLLIFSIGITLPTNAAEKQLLGAGATFPYPLYAKMFHEYYKEYKVKVNYQAIGSGGGIRQLINKTVDFGATDAFMKDKEMQQAGDPILHVPTCLGAVVLTYNLPGIKQLKLTPEIIADIFLGKINKWNDVKIANVNPLQTLPDMNIVVVHRSDGSGTTFIFSDYLSKVSSDWSKRVGAGKSLNWLVGLGAKGNPGVAGLIRQVPGALGYVELIYAMSNNMPVAKIKNKSGVFVTPSIESVSIAGDIDLPYDTRVSITDTEAKRGYPISGFTWIIFYKEQHYNDRSMQKAEELLKLLWWVTHDGQKYTESLHYAPLPQGAVKKAAAILHSALYNGVNILQK